MTGLIAPAACLISLPQCNPLSPPHPSPLTPHPSSLSLLLPGTQNRDILKATERERDREAQVLAERRRVIRSDLEVLDPEDECEPWARRPVSSTRRAMDRR
jgi:hypothetical protein